MNLETLRIFERSTHRIEKRMADLKQSLESG
jgi:hypothetical protein